MTPHQALAHPGPREDALRHRHSTGFLSPGTGLLRPNASVMAVTEGGPDSPEQQETLGPERLIGLPHVTEVARAEPGPTLSFCSVKLSDMGNVSKRLGPRFLGYILGTPWMGFWRRWDPVIQVSAREGEEGRRNGGFLMHTHL